MATHQIASLAIFVLTYLALAAGEVPMLRVDRCGVAVVGAVAMVLSGALGKQHALAAIDFNTLGLLLGMMLIVANLKLSGALAYLARLLFGRAGSGFWLLAISIALSGLLAAFFVNDVVCLILTPVLLEASLAAGLPPLPFLLGLATASNIGSAATLTGNPQNMIVAGFAGLHYSQFLIHIAPGAALGLVVDYAIIALWFRRSLDQRIKAHPPRRHRLLRSRAIAIKASLIALGVLGFLVAGFSPTLVALSGGALSLLTRRIRPQRIYREVDWTLLLMFAGLFVVVGGVAAGGWERRLVSVVGLQELRQPAILSATVALLSNLVSNVPAVLLFRPLLAALGKPQQVGLLLAAASTYAGNLTVLGSMANLIVLEQAHRHGLRISFRDYLKVGLPVGLITLALATLTIG